MPRSVPGQRWGESELCLQLQHRSPLPPRTSESAIALVITLILLSVITFMAITFLVLSTRDRGAVTTTTDQAAARLAAEAALERAKADLIARILATTNANNYDIFASVAYRNPNGFVASGQPGFSAFTNVNYDYKADGSAFTLNERYQNINNLLYDPIAPVYVTLNRLTGSNDFRYYIDVNRNGAFEQTGLIYLTNSLGQQMFNPTNSAQPLTANVMGDPQWIGILERPGFPHSPTNRFVARIAYLALPASKTLDLNYMHNVGHAVSGTPAKPARFSGYDYLRDQGFATYEENLAAFFRDLNTNQWPAASYNYSGTNATGAPNTGNAFDDARQLLCYRNIDYRDNNGKSVFALFGRRGQLAFSADHINGYLNGTPMFGTSLSSSDPDTPVLTQTHWFGADNFNHFFSTQDLFDYNKTAPDDPRVMKFTDRLIAASTNLSTYDRYTFYRLLSQLGTDSVPEPTSKMNLNYDNLVQPNPTTGARSATNFLAWRATDFFTNAAARLLADTFGENNPNLNINRIPVSPATNYYTASVHRLLQLAANLYDACANTNPPVGSTSLATPTTFRPIFRREPSGQIIIAGYREVTSKTGAAAPDLALSVWTGTSPGWYEMDNTSNSIAIPPAGQAFGTDDVEPMISGFPLIVGARKGWPSFNQFGMQTIAQITRKMQFLRLPKSADPTTMLRPNRTNIMYLFSITNMVGLEAWNSYTNYNSRDLQLLMRCEMTATITNELGQTLLANRVSRGTNMPINANTWPGFVSSSRAGQSFEFPLDPSTASFYFLTNCQYSQGNPAGSKLQFLPLGNPTYPPFIDANPPTYDVSTGFFVPRMWLTISTHLRLAIVDVGTERIVDYVNLDSFMGTPESRWNLTDLLTSGGACGGTNEPWVPDGTIGSIFCTNRGPGVAVNDTSVPTYGMRNQTYVSEKGKSVPGSDWNSYQPTPQSYDIAAAVDFFLTNMGMATLNSGATEKLYVTNEFYAPYAPTRSISFYTTWSANDPLVHYMIDDLKDLGSVTNVEMESTSASPMANLQQRNVSKRYDPWSGGPMIPSEPDEQKFDVTRKDPAMFRSDYWDFPTNRWPNIGWIGRVHRGTPWQTVYLKQPAAVPALWKSHTGNARLLVNKGQIPFSIVASNAIYEDATFSRPTNDWRLVDLFTTSISDNTSRGQMSVNQSGLAAWSAILSGVIVLTNNATDNYFVSLLRATPAGVPLPPPPTAPLAIDPAGAYNIYDTTVPLPPLVTLVNAINAARANTNLFSSQTFSHVCDILAVPELTVASPFLNESRGISGYQMRYGINDEMYERIPQQILGLLKVESSPRYVVYSWGQALKPADRSVVMNGTYSGLCTNYQISAEFVTRTVFRVEGAPKNPNIIVESYNIMGPD